MLLGCGQHTGELVVTEQGPGWPDGTSKEIPIRPSVDEGPTVDQTRLRGWRGGRGKREQVKVRYRHSL